MGLAKQSSNEIGMLMLAALPQRLSDQDRIERLERTIYEPSRTAQISGYRNVTIGSPGDPSPALLKRDGYFNRFGDTGWTPANSRMEFVNQAMRMICEWCLFVVYSSLALDHRNLWTDWLTDRY